MKHLLRKVSALGAVAVMGLSPAAALAEVPIGTYQTPDRKLDFFIELCGQDDRLLCITLTGIRDSADVPQVREFLNRRVVDRATPSGANRWRGTLNFSGYAVYGELKLTPGESVVMAGCTFIVVCDDITLIPAL